MACSCGASACKCDPTVLRGPAIGRTLISSLTGTVDCLRNIATDLGARPYQVFMVWTRWSGGERGEGIEEVIREERVLPTPLVQGMDSVSDQLKPIGMEEVGQARVSQISPRYNEDLLMGRDEHGQLPDDQNFYWEIVFPRPHYNGERRRFYPDAPEYHPTKFEWRVKLDKIGANRTRKGEPNADAD